MTGAAQHRVRCPHLEASLHRNAEYCMASKISRANHEFFVQEERVADGVTKEQLREWHAEAKDAGGNLVCCNSCDKVLLVGNGLPKVLHDGEPEDADDSDRIDAEPELRDHLGT